MNYDKYLPIGTVVLLRGGTKKAMITGFCTFDNAHQDKLYDYSGCIYPEGMLSSKQVLLFNHDQIEKIFFLGYVNDEEKEFKPKLNELAKQVESQLNSQSQGA